MKEKNKGTFIQQQVLRTNDRGRDMNTDTNKHRPNSVSDYKIVTCDASRASNVFPKMLSKVEFEPREYDLVLVKPNLCGMYHPQLQLLECTLRYLEPFARRIVIGETDSMGHTPERQFKSLRIWDLIKKFEGKIEAVNLMKDEILNLKVPSPHVVDYLPIPKLVHDCNLLVNISKVGTHSRTMLTCALKNLFGLLAERDKYGVYHPLGVDKVIADLAKIVRCDLNVVDARDRVIVGLDPLPVDILACKFVNLDPLQVGHLELVSQDRNLKLNEIMNQIKIIKI